MKIRKGQIPWEVLELKTLENDGLVKWGYIGGLKLGPKIIYLLEHREFQEDGQLMVPYARSDEDS